MNGFLRDRVRLTAGLLLGISLVCTGALLFGAGNSAMETFAAEQTAGAADGTLPQEDAAMRVASMSVSSLV